MFGQIKIIQNENKIDCLCDCDSLQGEIGDDKVKNFQDLLSP